MSCSRRLATITVKRCLWQWGNPRGTTRYAISFWYRLPPSSQPTGTIVSYNIGPFQFHDLPAPVTHTTAEQTEFFNSELEVQDYITTFRRNGTCWECGNVRSCKE